MQISKIDTEMLLKDKTKRQKKNLWKLIKKQKFLIFMSLPFVVWIIIFKYMPLIGWSMAFQDYKPGKSFFDQTWTGLKQFKVLFTEQQFYQSLENTIAMSLLGLVFGTICAIGFALLLNELKNVKFKKSVQTISYLPHFISWVVAASIITSMLAPSGIVNELLVKFHIINDPISFMSDPSLFWGIVTTGDIWKEMGWNAIIYLAAITAIDPEMYDAAKVDGAGRIRQIISITLPSIKPTIIVLLIMSIGNLLNIGFEKQMLLGNPVVADKSLVIDKYALDYGIGMFRYSFGTAIGIFRSIVSIILLFSANKLAKRAGEGALI
ncbi:putative aldouronate transport system permease protein [Clostridium saccharoperbutylacetonicum]|uniref:Carbohydrate ABC transporter membrane protein 1, CUT1 family n=1 Tax=Clostridium saccharoperbutylacetonicum N1-4(HMT) TaxID=931276 RepID=M1MCC5_9CLOT|nr:ABC transporter permease subunit [Clostridium saccharoperbutylacetonicum]AGF54083.1 carbohydrate ABC transporter membrane protein 1, CUT1 family [Clostridium saccharoperbutylacetonicum N1-4(HMT)]NRT59404.1 putative aldouronate transport system permease protein [Clostridium saccharoperbutylacetonicum]NSB28595.1 putative aldouronate transport system permease protein [Clostridium saccharoperbutylacetonicum]NSB42087.1 putative aldouronate transport system permease protein [Clostridium saccharope